MNALFKGAASGLMWHELQSCREQWCSHVKKQADRTSQKALLHSGLVLHALGTGKHKHEKSNRKHLARRHTTGRV